MEWHKLASIWRAHKTKLPELCTNIYIGIYKNIQMFTIIIIIAPPDTHFYEKKSNVVFPYPVSDGNANESVCTIQIELSANLLQIISFCLDNMNASKSFWLFTIWNMRWRDWESANEYYIILLLAHNDRRTKKGEMDDLFAFALHLRLTTLLVLHW